VKSDSDLEINFEISEIKVRPDKWPVDGHYQGAHFIYVGKETHEIPHYSQFIIQ
jgi:hypothetical protein